MSATGRRAVFTARNTDVSAAWERHVHRASHVAPNSPDLNPVHCAVWDALQQMVYQSSTIHDNQPAEAGNHHWVGQTIAAFYWSRHWSVASPAWGSSRSKANTLNIWCKNGSMWVTLAITETINMFPVGNVFKMCCYRIRLVFNCCFEDTHISQGSVATQLRRGGIFGDSIITLFLLILRVK